ncbi:MAG: CsgG/HfaB family protein [Acidobacteriota bacterium]
MNYRRVRFIHLTVVLAVISLSIACNNKPDPVTPIALAKAPTEPVPEPETVRVSVLATPTDKTTIPPGSTIVVTDLKSNSQLGGAGLCAMAVKDALKRRLVENANYQVLSREDLDTIVDEMSANWNGMFDSKQVEQLGNLLGASYFIVGRIPYCGLTSNTAPDAESRVQYSIFATLQIIDIKSGRVEVSSASEGDFIPRSTRLANMLDLPLKPIEPEEAADEAGEDGQAKGGSPQSSALSSHSKSEADLSLQEGITDKYLRPLGSKIKSSGAKIGQSLGSKYGVPLSSNQWKGTNTLLSSPAGSTGSSSASAVAKNTGDITPTKGEQYQVFKAAEDLANGFADDFFARPVWHSVEMWDDQPWSHSDAVHHVKVGDCARAVEVFEKSAYKEVPRMNQLQLARYLHNYGISLLCNNQREEGVAKLHSAYRLGYSKTTLRMLGLAGKVEEWALRTESDNQPEMDQLIENSTIWSGELAAERN